MKSFNVIRILMLLMLFTAGMIITTKAQIPGQGTPLQTPQIKLEKANGTVGNLSNVNPGDDLGTIDVSGYLNGQFKPSARIRFNVPGSVPNMSGMPSRIGFETGGDNMAERMVIDSGGNVGIGILNPAEMLHLNGNIQMDGQGNGIVFPDGSKLQSAMHTDTMVIDRLQVSDYIKLGDSSMFIGTLAPTGGFEIFSDTDNLLIQSNFHSFGLNTILNALPNYGRVGIGTAAPMDKLHVANGDVRIDALGGSTISIVEATVNGKLIPKSYPGVSTEVLTGDGFWTDISTLVSGGADTDWSGAGTGKMYATNTSDDVGIGTTNPLAKMHIKQNNQDFDDGIRLEGSVPGTGNILMRNGHLRLLNGQSGYRNGILIDNSGYVGINRSFPLARLHIQQDTDAFDEGIAITNAAQNDFGSIWLEDKKIHIHKGSDTGNGITIDSSGYIGINRNNPAARLNIFQAAYNDNEGIKLNTPIVGNSAEFYLDNSSNLHITRTGNSTRGIVIGQDGFVGINRTSPTARLHIKQDQDTSSEGIRLIDASGSHSGRIWMNGGDIHIVKGSGTDNGIIIHSNGGVSIEESYLPSGYKLAVNGKAICEELRVALRADWPDYVFDKDYDLPDLKEVEIVIKNEGHLPGIPSSTQIEENGQHVGDIQRRLLEKIEELTLYLIEMDKKLDMHKSHIEQFKSENNELRSTLTVTAGKEDK